MSESAKKMLHDYMDHFDDILEILKTYPNSDDTDKLEAELEADYRNPGKASPFLHMDDERAAKALETLRAPLEGYRIRELERKREFREHEISMLRYSLDHLETCFILARKEGDSTTMTQAQATYMRLSNFADPETKLSTRIHDRQGL
ncbi:hypothetical protein [Paraburkholderia terrae]|uniref:hypothetical protein n=1 Tax=Paraburkholderia terrae TaxID=311230 RepID=UPI0020609C74|nr:hypothetical protein [Paraburkholderia terrae]BDC37902.1 hypothetical protein PTKU15_11990 [Paraburkholderia terrae]